jgi:hypothetical protein
MITTKIFLHTYVVKSNFLQTFFLLKENKQDMLWSMKALEQKKNTLL